MNLEKITTELVIQRLNRWSSRYKKNGRLTSNHLDRMFPRYKHHHAILQSVLTSFGSFWEDLAIELAKKNGFIKIDKKKFNNEVFKLSKNIEVFRDDIRKKIENNDISIDVGFCKIKNHIFSEKTLLTKKEKIKAGAGIDFFFRKGKQELMGDIKSPQENVGNGKKLIEHLLIWSSHRFAEQQTCSENYDLRPLIVLPYNPFKDIDTYHKKQGNKLRLLQSNILIGDEFWEIFTGQKDNVNKIFNVFSILRESKEVAEIEKLLETYPAN